MHTLPPAQEIFNKVAAHLLKQGRPARNSEDSCRYRTESGLSCAVGCLIPDRLYSPSFEGASAPKVIKLLYDAGLADWREHRQLLQELQWVHDECTVLDDNSFNIWSLRARLADLADRFKLEFSA